MLLTERSLNRATLQRQHLSDRASMDATAAVRSLVALQAQEPPSPYIALWNRLVGFDPVQLSCAIAERRLVKASLLRITLHLVAAEDYPAYHQAMTPVLRGSRLNDARFREAGIPQGEVDSLVPGLLDFLANVRTKEEINGYLGDRLGVTAHDRLWWALRTYAPVAHAPVKDPWSFARIPVFGAAPRGSRPTSKEAVSKLITDYLRAFGPASISDFSQFTLLRRSDIDPALESLGGSLIEREGPSGTLLDLPGMAVPEEDEPAPPRLLPMWDSVLLAYRDRRRVIPEEYRKLVIRRNGDVLPTMLVDGKVSGVWRPTEAGIEATAFRELSDTEWNALGVEARSFFAVFGEHGVAVYRRYRRWWNELPSAQQVLLDY